MQLSLHFTSDIFHIGIGLRNILASLYLVILDFFDGNFCVECKWSMKISFLYFSSAALHLTLLDFVIHSSKACFQLTFDGAAMCDVRTRWDALKSMFCHQCGCVCYF